MNLYPYQEDTKNKLIQAMTKFGGACNCNFAGSGKTIVQLKIIQELGLYPALIVAPKSPTYVWANEIEKWELPMTYAVAVGTPKQRLEAIRSKPQVLVTSYDMFRGKKDPTNAKKRVVGEDLKEILATDWQMVALDEAHSIGSSSQRSRLTRKLKSKYKVLITASPYMNNVLNWWYLMDQLPVNPLGKYIKFVWKYMNQDLWGGLKEKATAYRDMNRILTPYVVRKTVEECGMELPECTEQDIEFELSKGEAKLYTQLKDVMLLEIEDQMLSKLEYKSTLQNALVRIQRLQELTDSPELLGDMKESSKIGALKELIKTII